MNPEEGMAAQGGTMHKKIYFGITGQLLSGKSTASQFFVDKYKAKHLRYSSGVLDPILNILSLPITRQNEQDLAVFLKDTYGGTVLVNALIEEAKSLSEEVILVDGTRKLDELAALRKLPGFKLIYIKTSIENRYQRMLSRGEKVGETSETLEEFKRKQTHAADEDLAVLEDHADFVVSNDGTVDDLHKELERIYKEGVC